MKKGDIFVIVSTLLISAIAYFIWIFMPEKLGSDVLIYVDKEEVGKFDINEDAIHKIETVHGENIIEIKGGEVRVISADCRDQICVNNNPISHNNETIICLPHRVVIEIDGGEELEIDAIVQ